MLPASVLARLLSELAALNFFMPPLLQVRDLYKSYQDKQTSIPALENVSLDIEDNQIVCLLGPSGSGKSTLLRIIGGLIRGDKGHIYLGNEEIMEPHPDVGMVFQKTNLMPWRSVLSNVLLPLEISNGRSKPADEDRAIELLNLVGLDGFAHAYPRQLSGGMSQRAVLARTLMQQPRLLLMDEPFSALDSLTRERLNLELLRIQEVQKTTILVVTHSINESVILSDRVLVMSERPGRIISDVAVELPRPRTLEQMGSEGFGRIATEIRGHLNMAATM